MFPAHRPRWGPNSKCSRATDSRNEQWIQRSDGALQVYANDCMDVTGASTTPGTPVQLYTCNGGPQQQWTINANGTITDFAGMCLDISGGSTSNGALLQVWTCNGSPWQQWRTPSAPTITSPSSAAFIEGNPSSFTAVATGYPTPTLTETGTLPSRVTFIGGVLSGTPTESGTYP